jgi:hypothetical protein
MPVSACQGFLLARVVPVVEYGKVAEDVPDRRRPPTALLRPLGRVRAEAKEDKGGAR